MKVKELMRICTISTFFIFILSTIVYAQHDADNLRFDHVDAQVSNVDKQFIFHPQLLVQKLTENLTNDYDKVRAFYVWIAKNIDYDLLAYNHDLKGGQSVNQVMRSGKALCSGFSLLFNYFCELSNIESVVIEGYAKGYGYQKHQQFTNTNHAWNAVKIYERWYLLDATWATGDPTFLARHQRKIDLNTWFLAEPDFFIKTHLPEDPSWQLIANKVSLSEFVNDEFVNNENRQFNSFSPNDYVNLNEYDKDILRYKRALNFNPGCYSFNESLSYAYLYKAISITDELWKLDYHQLMHSVNFLEDTFYSYMDSSWTIIASLDHSKVKAIMPDEINYQKGVINYEFGVEIFMKAMNLNIPLIQFDEITEKYFQVSKNHFENVNSTSIYFKDANEYLIHINDFRNRKKERLSSD